MKAAEKDLYIVRVEEIQVIETVLGKMRKDKNSRELYYTNLGISVKNLNKLLKKYSDTAFVNDKTARNYIAERNRIIRTFEINKNLIIKAKIIRHFVNRDVE